MNADIFAEWLRLQGHRVVRTKSSYWFDQGPRAFQAFPYHWLLQPAASELTEFLKSESAIGLRFSTPIHAAQGGLSYHAVYEKSTYDLRELGKWARKNVRRGLARCSVEPISFGRLAEDGFALQIDTLNRQARRLHLQQNSWRTRCLSAGDLPGFEAWGALINGRLTASVITFQMDDCCYMLYQQCHRDFLVDHVNNALSFVVTQTMIHRPNIRSILYGLHSLDAPPSVDDFKFRMGYTARPVRQRVVFHPLFKPFVNPASHGVLKVGRMVAPGNPTLAKAEGMFRFYLQGRQPLPKQPRPEPLRELVLS